MMRSTWRVIALDTATDRGGVALVEAPRAEPAAAQVVASAWAERGGQHSANLLPLADSLLAATGWKPADLDLVAVTTGPGSFTGLRIGVTTAKGLAYGWRKPVVPVGTLDVLAAQAGWSLAPVLPGLGAGWGEQERGDGRFRVVIGAALRSRRGEFYVQLFELPPQPLPLALPALGEPQVMRLADWQAAGVAAGESDALDVSSSNGESLLVMAGEASLCRQLRGLWPGGRGRIGHMELRWAGEGWNEWDKPEPGTVGRLAVAQVAAADPGGAADARDAYSPLTVVPRYYSRSEV